MTTADITWNHSLLEKVRESVRAVKPGARIVLYGSRARGDAKPDSDWDILVLIDGERSLERDANIRHRRYNVEREGIEL